LSNVIFSNNRAEWYGGGMYNYAPSPLLTNVTFSGNSAGIVGGGMWNEDSSPALTNVTFSGNSAIQDGGGIYNDYNSSPTLTNVTFSGNSAIQDGGGIYNLGSSSNPVIHNTIFWGNTASSLAAAQMYNYFSTPAVHDSVMQGGAPSGGSYTNILTTDPRLGTLGNYGGVTQTIPLLPGSSAINTGDDALCPATDQRGVTRPQGAHCDIGAFELVLDTTPPDTTIINKPASLDNISTPTFTFSGDDGAGSGVVSFQCRLDGGAYSTCTSPYTSPALVDGLHTFYVYAIDAFDNADASPASWSWTLDSLSPGIASIVRLDPNPVGAANLDFSVTFSGAVSGADAGDFILAKTGSLAGESVTNVSGGPVIYTVTIHTGTGAGYLRLDVPASASITSLDSDGGIGLCVNVRHFACVSSIA